jgi:hypothetical protein
MKQTLGTLPPPSNHSVGTEVPVNQSRVSYQ